jgi:hypothetical protein
MFSIGYFIFHSMLSVGRSMFDVRRSMFDVQSVRCRSLRYLDVHLLKQVRYAPSGLRPPENHLIVKIDLIIEIL